MSILANLRSLWITFGYVCIYKNIFVRFSLRVLLFHLQDALISSQTNTQKGDLVDLLAASGHHDCSIR